MSRDALIVGISHYQHLNDLKASAQDAEAVARCLETYGQFKVKRLPEVITKERTSIISKTKEVSINTLKQALEDLFCPKGNETPEVALFYFSGHGLRTEDIIQEGHIATSDTNPIGNNWGLLLDWLRKLLKKSPVRQQIVWLDCCYGGGLFDFDEANPGESGDGKRRCFIAASRSFEEAYEDLKNPLQSAFTKALIEGLNPVNAPGGRVDSLLLSTRITRGMPSDTKQVPIPSNTGEPIVITWTDKPETPEPKERSYVPRQAEKLPSNYIPRPEPFDAVKKLLLQGADADASTLVVSAIYGLGGIGKSVLAAALAVDDDIQARFPDGTLWITLGQNPDLLPMLGSWIQALGDYKYQPLTPEAASSHLRTLLYERQMLLVVDDVWSPVHLEPFRVGGQGSCVLVTTRGAPISGAQKYDLDVMTPEQAMQLLTHQVSTPLSAEEEQQAAAFAKRVGYLPLALELATAQIEEGLTWEELLTDYGAEVERLEILDKVNKEDIPDDALRRKYSLCACFNLSLKSLTPEQQTYFAWLGVLPEDADITKRMAKTLWQLTERQAENVLRAFRTKGLLKGERPTYRLHDLMHDLAVQLLSGSGDGETLAGVGTTLPAAHQQFLGLYQQQTQNGQWHTIGDDGHIYDYLTWHMVEAGCGQQIHQLLQETTEKGRNGWYTACEQVGKPALFASDLARGWQLTLDEQLPVEEAIPLQVRYAFIRASLNSLADNIPAEMVEGLLKVGLWQPAQALAYAQQTYNPWRRAEYLMALAPYMPRVLLPEVLTLLEQINFPAYTSIVLSKLAPKFPELWPSVLDAITEIQDVLNVLSLRRGAKGFSYRALAIARILADLPSRYLPHALNITRTIQDESDRAWALSEMAQYLPDLWEEALSLTRTIQNEPNRAWTLYKIAQYLPHLCEEALTMTHIIQNESDRARALSDMAKYLPEPLWEKALSVTRTIQSEPNRAWVLREVAQYLPEPLWEEALAVTRTIHDESYRATALSAMAEHRPDLWEEALSVMSTIQDEPNRAWALSKMAKHLPEPLWEEALSIMRTIQDELYRATALSEMAKYLPDLWEEALRVTRTIQNESHRATALRKIAKYLPDLWEEAFTITRTIQDESYRATALREIAKYLPDLWEEAFTITRTIQNESDRAWALSEMAEHLPNLWEEALRVTRTIQNESDRVWALSQVTEHLPETLWEEALRVTRTIQNESYRAEALSVMAKYLPELWEEAFTITRTIQDESRRATALREMAKHLPETLWEEALRVTRTIQNESYRAWTLSVMAKYLPEPLWEETLTMTRNIPSESGRASVLIQMAKHLPDLWEEVLSLTRNIPSESDRASVLSEMAKHLPETLWEEVLSLTCTIPSESDRASVLSEMAKHLPDLWEEVLSLTCTIPSESDRTSVLSEMAKHLPEPFWGQIQVIIWNFSDRYYKATALQAYLPYLANKSITFTEWSKTLDALAYHNRQQLLESFAKLRPVIINLSDKETFMQTLQVIDEIHSQWP